MSEDMVRHLSTELEKAHRQLAEVSRKIESGKMVEFEYEHTPKVRSYKSVPHIQREIEKYAFMEHDFIKTMNGFKPFFNTAMKIEETATERAKPSWRNPWFPLVDAITTYCLIASVKPDRYIEVGSGNSTKFAKQAVLDHSPETKIISIDPYPRDEIDSICDEVIRHRFEDMDSSFFKGLTNRDIFFFDSSHRLDQGSDVAVYFCEILPSLPAGMIYGIHDIMYPDRDYHDSWLDRHYGEQYMLMMYLLGGAQGDRVVLPCYYVSQRPHLYKAFEPLLDSSNLKDLSSVILGHSFWMQRRVI